MAFIARASETQGGIWSHRTFKVTRRCTESKGGRRAGIYIGTKRKDININTHHDTFERNLRGSVSLADCKSCFLSMNATAP